MAFLVRGNRSSVSDWTAQSYYDFYRTIRGEEMTRGIVTLCGSVRFKDEFVQANRELTLAGWIVLAPGVFEHDWLHKPENNAELRKDGLDKLHCEKIDLSDSILVLNKDGYVGKSTQRE